MQQMFMVAVPGVGKSTKPLEVVHRYQKIHHYLHVMQPTVTTMIQILGHIKGKITQVNAQFKVIWSEEDQEYIATVNTLPSLSWLAPTPVKALQGLISIMQTDLHPESVCHSCHGPNIIWTTPSPLWNMVMRNNDIAAKDMHDGIVCPSCFALLAEEQGIATKWRLLAEDIKVELRTITPLGRVWDNQSWMWE